VPERIMRYSIFVDYDNLLPSQKIAGMLDLLTKALIQLPLGVATTRARCEARVYGGWYEGNQITRRAQDVTVEIQRDFPKVIRLPSTSGNHMSVSTSVELAVALLQEPSHHLFNTYRRKGKPANVRVAEKCDVGCNEADCLLPLMKRFIGSGNCPKAGCAVTTGNLIYRNEQKIVDTMLACDLIYAANGSSDQVILISGDDDFLPPLRAVLLSGTAAVRIHPRPHYQRASFPPGGAQLLELGL